MKYSKTIINIVVALSFLFYSSTIASFAEESPKHNYKPKEGYVPDEETAIRIAVSVWIPIYGKEQIESEKPYYATLSNGIWSVSGSLPKGWIGGVAEAEISKDDGKIIRISHGK